MKKLFAFIFFVVLACSAFATSYKVISIEGTNAKYEVETRIYEPLEVGQVLKGEEYINIGVNTSIVVVDLDNPKQPKRTIKAMKKGRIDSLYAEAFSSKTLKKMNIAKADFSDNATGTRPGVATAASRASEAKEDFDWAE